MGKVDYFLGTGVQSISLRILAFGKVTLPILPLVVFYYVRRYALHKYALAANRSVLILIAYFIILVVSICIVLQCPYAGPRVFFLGFHHEIEGKISPNELYSWASGVRTRFAKQDEVVMLPAQEIPGFLKILWSHRTPSILVSPLSETNLIVDIYYGGGFGHWGLIVGHENLRMTSDGELIFAQIAPGIYAYSGP